MSKGNIPKGNEVTIKAVEENPMADFIIFDDEVYGKRYFTRSEESYAEVTKPPVEPVQVNKNRIYEVQTRDSFVEYVKKYADPTKGIILLSEDKITMFFNELSRTEKVNFPLKKSLELVSFLGEGPITRDFKQKDFLKLLETFPEVVAYSSSLLPNIELLQMDSQTTFESNVDPDNIVFMFKTTKGNQTASLPKQLTLTLPYFEGGKEVEIIVDFEVELPKTAEEKPFFTLTDFKFKRTRRDAIKAEIDDIRNSLSGWMFIQGKEQ